jgi:predicted permease
LRASGYALSLLVLLLVVATCSVGFGFASPCSVQLGYPIIPVVYANTIVTAVVPLSATCSASYGNQLYATATAYDLNSNTSASTVNTILTSADGGYTFAGQVGFNLPASTQGHWVQIAVTIYENQSGNQLTTSGEAFRITPGTAQVVTTTVTEPTSYQFALGTNERTPLIFTYVAIAAILATVIIVTVGLVVYSRRPKGYYQTPRTY